MSFPSTKILDHIIHLTPPGSVEQVSQQFTELGFTVIPGGTHTGGFTANALVILSDGVYLELIAFTHPPSAYPPNSPDRHRRDTNPWASKSPGWIDFAFLGATSTSTSLLLSISDIINQRAENEGTNIRYAPQISGGRTRHDGIPIQWVLNTIDDAHADLRGSVPFFCGDVTPRCLRVPTEPPSNSVHASGVLGIAYLRILAEPTSLEGLSAKLTSVIGDRPQRRDSTTSSTDSDSEYVWTLETPTSELSRTTLGVQIQSPRLILNGPKNDEETEHISTKGPGIFEVAFWVGQEGEAKESMTPYGKIVWLRS